MVAVMVCHQRPGQNFHAALDRPFAVRLTGIVFSDPLAPTKEVGGTGRRHDWEISRRIREELEVEVPLFLAGGLNPAKGSQAVSQVGPYG